MATNTPLQYHVPPLPAIALATVIGGPPETSIFFSEE